MLDHFKRFARYNAWANQHLYSACSLLPRDTYLQPRPSFFGSLRHTLTLLREVAASLGPPRHVAPCRRAIPPAKNSVDSG